MSLRTDFSVLFLITIFKKNSLDSATVVGVRFIWSSEITSAEVKNMLKIGEFSKLSRVSVRMLRHYDDVGLLKPVKIDKFTGYRYYNVDQLTVIGKITALKDMGFTLSETAKILDNLDNKDIINEFFEKKRCELENISKETAKRMMLLETAHKRLRKEQNMNYNISIKEIPERYAATLQMTIPHYEDEGMAWSLLCRETDSLNLIPADPCLTAVSFLDDECKDENVEILLWKTVKGTYHDTEHVKFKNLPAAKVAACTIKGAYEQLNECYAAMFSWISENGYKISDAFFNIYHISPYETQNPEEFVTEVCFPVE